MDAIQKQLLEAVAGLHEIPVGAYNIRANGKSEGRNSTEHIEITTREEGDGIIIRIKDGTKKESVHIPVIMSQAGLEEVVYNDFYVGDDCDVTIIAGCGIHNGGDASSRHDGIHSFFIGKNSRVKYVEKHYGSGDGKGQRIMNPETIIEVGENSVMEMDTVQIKGVDSTKRMTRAKLMDGASLKVMERLMTHGTQDAESRFIVDMDGEDSGANIVSRSVAKDDSHQLFQSVLNGNAACSGHCGQCQDQLYPGDHCKQFRRSAHPRGCHRQDRRRADHKAYDTGAYRGRGGGPDHQWFPEVKQ